MLAAASGVVADAGGSAGVLGPLAPPDRLKPPEAYLANRRRLADYPAPNHLDAAIDLLGDVGTLEDAQFLSKVGGLFNLSQPAFIRSWARKAARKIKGRLGK